MVRALKIGVLAVLIWFALHLSAWAQAFVVAVIVIMLTPMVRMGYERLRYGPRRDADGNRV